MLWCFISFFYTHKKMETVLGLGETGKHEIAVIAIEKQFDGQYREKVLPKNIHAAFNLTEFLESDKLGIDRTKLHEYNKKTIPHATVDSR